MWLTDEYIYRRQYTVGPALVDVPQGHPVEIVVPLSVFASGKVRGDHQDLEIVHEDAEGANTALYRTVERDNFEIRVTFPLAEAISEGEEDSNYYVYYGNPDLVNVPTRDVTTYEEWPVTYEANGGEITYTRPGEHWESGVSTTEGARANLLTYAKALRVDYGGALGHGIASSVLDGGAETLTDLGVEAAQSVYEVYTDLAEDELHELEIKNIGESSSISDAFTIKINGVDVVLPLKSLDLGERVNSIVWSSSFGGV